MKIRVLYNRFSEVLLESGGLTSGLYDETKFLAQYVYVLQDFLEKTGIVKKIICIPIEAGTHRYTLPGILTDPQVILHDGRHLNPTDGFSQETLKSNWYADQGDPEVWRNDRMGMKSFEIAPAPRLEGSQVEVDDPAGFYGTVSAFTPGDISLSSLGDFYGIPSSDAEGDVYFETEGPFFGTISEMIASPNNISVIGVAAPFNRSPILDDEIELLPVALARYLLYGILQSVFADDTELKDVVRERYCGSRYMEGINLALAIVEDPVRKEN